jgi:uncharacterized protein with HEPN domain
MPRSHLLYLNDILVSTDNFRLYVGNLTYEEFIAEQMRIDAVIRNFEIIGEAVKNLSDDLKAEFPATDWKAVACFRDTLIHAYFGVDLEILWDIIVHKVLPLQEEVTAIMLHERTRIHSNTQS